MKNLLLLQPPATKPSEPPLALAVLLASLRSNGITAEAMDANLGAYRYLLQPELLTGMAGSGPPTAVRRALKHLPGSLEFICSAAAATRFDRYATAVRYLNLLLELNDGRDGTERLSLGDYQNRRLSPFDPGDLAALAHGEHTTLFSDYFRLNLLPQVKAVQPQLVAISINYLNQALPAFELAGLLRREFPAVELVAGGGLLTSWRQMLRDLDLRLPPFDRVVFGPGEAPLLELACGTAGDDYFLENGTQKEFVPDFSFASLAEYLSPEPVLPLSTSRGCYWKQCLFCPEATAPVQSFAMPESVIIPELMRLLATEFGVRHFHLTDNAIPMAQLAILAESKALLQGLNWYGFVRFEKALENENFVRRLGDSGCRMLQLGLESGSQPVLDRLGKGIRLAGAAKILENLHRAGIASYVYVMLGIPGETEADAELTRSFLLEHAPKIDYLNLSIMNLPRSSELLDNPQEHGIAASQLLSESTPLGLYRSFTSTGNWERQAARRFLDRRLLGEPVIRAIVRRTPPWFTSNHAHFFGQQED